MKLFQRWNNKKISSFFSLTVCPEDGVPLLTRKPLMLSGKTGQDSCNIKPAQKQKSECLDDVR
jgi:hypothetical protein